MLSRTRCKKIANDTTARLLRDEERILEEGMLWEMDHGALLMDHEHREETPILRKCQEFSHELLAFATTAARARVRGSVMFLLGCNARSIAPSRAFSSRFTLALWRRRQRRRGRRRRRWQQRQRTVRTNDDDVPRKEAHKREDRLRDETSVTHARINTTRTRTNRLPRSPRSHRSNGGV